MAGGLAKATVHRMYILPVVRDHIFKVSVPPLYQLCDGVYWADVQRVADSLAAALRIIS
jgi:hypothetical protein